MTPTSSEKQAALSCRIPCAGFKCNCKEVLAAALRQAEKELKYERENIEGVLALVDEQAQIFQVEAIGSLGQKIHALASGIQMRAEKAASRLKTLEEENARMRPVVDAAIRFTASVEYQNVQAAREDQSRRVEELEAAVAALNQEAE